MSRLRNTAAAQLRSTDAGTGLGLQTLSFSKEAAQQSILFTSAVNCRGWAQQAVVPGLPCQQAQPGSRQWEALVGDEGGGRGGREKLGYF